MSAAGRGSSCAMAVFLAAAALLLRLTGRWAVENRIRELRKRLGLRQKDLARELGVTRQTIHAIKNNKYAPDLALAMRLACLLEKPAEELLALPESLLHPYWMRGDSGLGTDV